MKKQYQKPISQTIDVEGAYLIADSVKPSGKGSDFLGDSEWDDSNAARSENTSNSWDNQW